MNEWDPQSVPLDALFPDETILPHSFNALHEELGSGGHEADGDGNCSDANPRAGLGVLHRELAFLFLEGIRGGWVERQRVIIARWVV